MKAKRQDRRAAVTVEFALTSLMLFTFLFAGIEFSRVNLIRNTIKNAAYEGARRGMVGGATASECEEVAQNLLDIISVQNAEISVTPSVIDESSESITVTIQVPLDSNGYSAARFFVGKTLQSSTTLDREQG